MATIGKTSIGASRNVVWGNSKQVHGPATLPVAADVASVTFYAAAGVSGSGDAAPVLYASSAGAPAALLGTGSGVDINPGTVGDGWFTLPFTAPIAVAAGDYFFGTIAESIGGVNWQEAYDAGGNLYHFNGDTYGVGPTNPFGTDNVFAWEPSYYITYTASAAPPTLNTIVQSNMRSN